MYAGGGTLADGVVWQVDIARGEWGGDGPTHYIISYQIENPDPCEAAEIAVEKGQDEVDTGRFPDWPLREMHVCQIDVPWPPVFMRRKDARWLPASS